MRHSFPNVDQWRAQSPRHEADLWYVVPPWPHDRQCRKAGLHNELRDLRAAMVATLDGLCEYDVRRPLTPTNLLGMVEHLATWESIHLGEVFGRPYSERLYTPDQPGTDLWVTAEETRHDIVDRYLRVADHADATIDALDIDAPGHVSWWPRPSVTPLNILVHMVTETARHAGHAGHADILRE